MLLIKGFIIGIGKIIPGVSGAVLAIALGEYENMINSVNDYFKDVINNSKYLFKIGIGILISIILFSNIIVKLMDKYYIYTMFLFGGFIIGSISDIKNNIRFNYPILVFSILGFILINSFMFSNSIIISKSFIYYLIGGFLESFTMITPGISGTAVLISYGCYNDIVYSISNIFMYKSISILIPFIIGMVFGVLITIKLISFLFNKYKNSTYNMILGISIATTIIMLTKGINSSGSVVISIILFLIGILISKKSTALLAVD